MAKVRLSETAAQRKHRWYTENKERHRERCRSWLVNNRNRRRDYILRRDYGISLETRDTLLASQGGVCAICKGSNPGRCDWHTDHDHVTSRVRGILCNRCNLILGLVKDDPQRLRNAADYLEAYRG